VIPVQRDSIDLFIGQWNRERPDLDPSPLAVVSRVLMLAKWLEHSADRALATFGLSLWQFDVLAALRRSGEPFRLSPTQLMQMVTLSSGAMTNRIDRLEELGLVARERDPGDRRGVLIHLTAEGRKLADKAIAVRLEDARRNVACFSKGEEKTLATLLRKLLLAVHDSAPTAGRLNGGSRRRARPATATGS
jgi:DNA-binding MarR family transcriptional regulator